MRRPGEPGRRGAEGTRQCVGGRGTIKGLRPLLSDLHLIATDYSGNTDFCRRPEFTDQVSAVPWRWVKVKPGQYPYAEGQRWANPDIPAAAAAMRRFVDNPPRAATPPPEGWPCFSARELGRLYAARLQEIR